MHYNKDRSGVGLILNFRHSSRAIIIRCASYISVTLCPHSPRIDAKLRITLQETKMSTLQNEMILENLFEEVQEVFPYLDEDKQAEIARKKFEDMCQ